MSEEQQAQMPAFHIEKIYVKDLSVEVPGAPQIFLEREAPQIDVQLNHRSEQVDGTVYHSTLTLTVTAKLKDKTMFLVEVQQGGIFRIQNVPQENLSAVLEVGCPNILFPYAREVVSDVTVRAGFPPMLLNPVNFEAMYMQKMQLQQQQQQQQQKAVPPTAH
jgi:preprotein translocase subunit SecB